MDERGRYLVYSVTKTFLGVLCLRLELELEAPVATWIDDVRLPRATLRQLLNHTSGIPDYGRLPEYGVAVRDTPSEPWSDAELLARALASDPDFEPGSEIGLGPGIESNRDQVCSIHHSVNSRQRPSAASRITQRLL